MAGSMAKNPELTSLQSQISDILTSLAVGFVCDQRYGLEHGLDTLRDDLQQIYCLCNPGKNLIRVANAMVDRDHGVDNPSRIDNKPGRWVTRGQWGAHS